ncbi:alpha/beta fold hydrolase [Nitrospirillum sp. BR 11163]|uniref:alpha/beta fold hydrolase n=1 Tax=Nitrospirillum sp. BR 11163 TaxID=3104323 RepID=UPI002AFFC1A5|nr:alpha/beta fold hydrolase [Nitrospirillum sp. BR 11163]MEA1676561.1 alpha/beta fold hydrolase [Nitrospirillum sp. BR 11163]
MPGLLCDAALWRHQMRDLAGQVEVRVPDLTGAESMVELAAGVLTDAPARFSLAALSMGGYVALEIMRQAGHRVERLALIDTSARPDGPEQRRRRQGLLALARTGRFQGVTPRLLPQLLHPDHQADPAIAGEVMAMADRVGRDAFIRQQTAILGRPDSRGDLASIHCPTLVAVGREDQVTPLECAEEMAGIIPGARLAVLDRCGHLPPMERPGETTSLLREWLRTA